MLLVVASSLLLLCNKECFGSLKFEKELHNDLLYGYNPDIRPEPGHGKPVDVHFDVRIKKLVKLDVRDQIFTINAFVMLKWFDSQLEWNRTKYDDVSQITMGTDLIWTPDIVLYNTADVESYSHTDYYKTKAFVSYNGEVIWTNPVTWMASCSFDVTWFPIDRQVCKLTFGSWTYTRSKLILEPWGAHSREIYHDHFTIKNGEWNILNVTVMQEDIKFPCCREPYSTMSKEFVLKRRALYYFLYILLPLISLAFLFMMVFFIPHESGERMGFGVTILLSITVYLLVISEALPEKSDNKSMLGICFITEFYLLCGALVLSLITINLHRKTSKPPNFILKMRRKYQYISKGLCKNARGCRGRSNIDGVILQVTAPLESDDCLHYNENTSFNNVSNEVRFRRTLLRKEKDSEEDEHENDAELTTMDNSCDDVEAANNKEWQEIAAFLDWVFFIVVLFFLGFIPVAVTMSLDQSGL